MKGSEQVAAVCYRIGKAGVEFLLVRTRGGRWIFPKGSIESGLTNAQAAALEAYEEAGVHGRMEEASFAGYVHRKGGGKRNPSGRRESTVHAHLCEVLRLGRPKELYREPTWFSVEKARSRLQQGRAPECGAELSRIVDLAVMRIRRLTAGYSGNEALRRVFLDSLDPRVSASASFSVMERRSPRPRRETATGVRVPPALVRIPRLTSGISATAEIQKVQVIEITDAPKSAHYKTQTLLRKKPGAPS